jgi:hypothetical protein
MCQSSVSLSWRVTLSVLAITLLLPDTANAQKQPVASEVPRPTSILTGAIPPMVGNLQPSQATASGSPLPVQVAQVPQSVPGYVTPKPSDPAPPPLVPMTPREIQLNQWLAANQGNPYAPAKVAAELGQLRAERNLKQDQLTKLYEAKITQQTELVKMREQQLADQAKRILDAQKEIEAGKKSHTAETVDGRFWRYDPTTRTWTDITPLR